MEFKSFPEKYISAAENAVTPDKERVVISNDAYAIGEAITDLIKKIEHARLSLIK